MKKRELLLVSLYAKFVIISFFCLLVGANYIFGVFWYDPTAQDIERQIASIKNIDQRNDFGLTALMVAAAEGKDDQVKLLVTHKSYPNARAYDQLGQSNVSNTPVHYAIQKSRIPIVQFLLSAKAAVNTYNSDENGFTPLHFCYRLTDPNNFKVAVQAFVDAGANINIRDKARGMSLLHWLVETNQVENLKVLINEFGYLVNFSLKGIKTNYKKQLGKNIWIGKTALDYAKELMYDSEIYRFLQDVQPDRIGFGANVNEYNDQGFTGVMIAALKGDKKYLTDLLSYPEVNVNALQDPNKSNIGNTALHLACLYDQPEMVKLLIEKGAEVIVRNKKGETPLHAVYGIVDSQKRKEVIQLFLKHGANINDSDNEGNSLLHKAVYGGDEFLVAQLVTEFKKNLNIRLKNKKKLNPLEVAQQYDITNISILQRIEKILKPFYKKVTDNSLNRFDKEGLTPFMHAAMQGDVELAKDLINRGSNINLQNRKGDTALHIALRFGNLNFIKWMLGGQKKQPVDVTKINKIGNSLLHEVFAFADPAMQITVVQLLFDKGVNINAQNNAGNTLAHEAVIKNAKELIEFLRGKFGAEVRNKEKLTPLELAKKLGKQEIVAILESEKKESTKL